MPAPRSSWRMEAVSARSLIDTRPRLVAETDLARLHDLTDLAVQELERG